MKTYTNAKLQDEVDELAIFHSDAPVFSFHWSRRGPLIIRMLVARPYATQFAIMYVCILSSEPNRNGGSCILRAEEVVEYKRGGASFRYPLAGVEVGVHALASRSMQKE